MALTKNNLDIAFASGLDTKTDSKRVQPGKFLALANSVFTKGGLLSKRNGFGALPTLPVTDTKTLTTFGGSLTAVSKALYNLAPETNTWYNRGAITSVSTTATPIVRSATSQTKQDVAVTPEGLSCAVWEDSDGTSKYQVNDTQSAQIIVSATNLPATASQARVFILGMCFIVLFLVTVAGTTHLQYIAIPLQRPTSPGTATDFGATATSVNSLTAGYDAVVAGNNIYAAWYDAGGDIEVAYLTSTFLTPLGFTIVGQQADYVSLAADLTTATPTIWVTFWNNSNNNLYASAYTSSLLPVLAPTVLTNNANINNVTSVATGMLLTVLFQTANTYSYSPNARTDYMSRTKITQAGVVVPPVIFLRSVGLASKAFIEDNVVYVMVVYGVGVNLQPTPGGGVFQPTYFLADSLGNLSAKLAYSNAGGYPASQVLPGVNLSAGTIRIGYLFKDLLTAVNKAQGASSVNGIYSQTGINLVSWTINDTVMAPAEIGNNLHLGGGFTWMYDGTRPVEHNFHVWPEDIAVTTATGSGGLALAQYFYQVTYEWTDAQGNLHRSAPSVPVEQTTTTASSTNTLRIPTLRLTYKTGASKVRIVIYRWSSLQQNYYQITDVQTPVINNTAVDSITYVDTKSDAQIIGNQLIYTTGGVIENIAYPGSDATTLYKSRMVIIDSEDKNLLWFSKQVIENVPVEPSDLFTLYVAPTAGAQGSTGVNTALSAMDDKLIIFKRNAIYYITGTGPDNTGANNDFSEPNYITSVAGCTNPQSIVFMPQGIMFQSDKGIWLLGRDLSTNYIGAPVEQYNSATVVAAINVPGTNQVRFTLDDGVTLMYDYYYGQWGTFASIPGITSTLYQNLHTYINSRGSVFQETVASYLDGSSPVLMSFTTGWMSLAGLQGFERAYFFYLLGTYLSPHKLSIGIAYDFDPSINQLVSAVPSNFNPAYGLEPGPYGSGDPYGGVSNVEQFRVFMDRQKCQAFQITLNEIYDPSHGGVAGAGLTLSGINLVVGAKKSYATLRAAQSVS